jgi:ribokinase
MRFGDKLPFESVTVVKAVGNAPNAAVAAARLGLESALVANLGADQNGKDCLATLQHDRVITTHVRVHKGKPTNYHFVLWYDVDRTILVNHVDYDYKMPAVPAPKWIYLTSLGASTFDYHLQIADYLEANPTVKLAFQPGTFQMKLGFKELKRIYDHTDIFFVNVEEAQRILGYTSDERDIKKLLRELSEHGPKLTVITDNTNGAYMFDGDHYYHIGMYPDPRPAIERTGCGDAFASTFVSAMAMGKSPLEAFTWAPINPMSVAQFIGAQEGLLSFDQLQWWLHRAPEDYKPKEF